MWGQLACGSDAHLFDSFDLRVSYRSTKSCPPCSFFVLDDDEHLLQRRSLSLSLYCSASTYHRFQYSNNTRKNMSGYVHSIKEHAWQLGFYCSVVYRHWVNEGLFKACLEFVWGFREMSYCSCPWEGVSAKTESFCPFFPSFLSRLVTSIFVLMLHSSFKTYGC